MTNGEKGHTSSRLHRVPKAIGFLGYVPLPDEGHGMSLGERIVRLRRTLGIRQDQLTRQLGVDPSTLARWERNKMLPLSKFLKLLNSLLVVRFQLGGSHIGSRNETDMMNTGPG